MRSSLINIPLSVQRAMAARQTACGGFRAFTVSATQNKASSALPVGAAEELSDAHHNTHVVKGKLDRYVLAKFGGFETKDAVPDRVDIDLYSRSNDQFRIWAITGLMLTSFVICFAWVSIGKILEEPIHVPNQLDYDRAMAQRAIANPSKK